jgi:hypothetical protein
VKWTVLAVIGAVVGGVMWAAHRKAQQDELDAALWAEATDPVVRFGES